MARLRSLAFVLSALGLCGACGADDESTNSGGAPDAGFDVVPDRNRAPFAVAEVQGHEVVPGMSGYYEINLSDSTLELTLDASKSSDPDGDEIVEYIWISGTLDPNGAPGRYVPPGEDEGWPADSVTTKVTLTEGIWVFHLYVRDNNGGLSSPATVEIVIGNPDGGG